jgi:hypothetical protein
MRSLIVAIVLAGCARAPDDRVQPVVADSSRVAGVAAPTETSSASRTPLDDTAAVMYAMGQQLRRDYRGGPLLFSARPTCDEPNQVPPCVRRSTRDPGQVPRAVTVAAEAAKGHLVLTPPGQPCASPAEHCRLAKDAVALLELGAPLILGDSAFVSVVATFAAEPGADTFPYERHIYRVTRMSKWHWRATARYLDSEGHFERLESR